MRHPETYAGCDRPRVLFCGARALVSVNSEVRHPAGRRSGQWSRLRGACPPRKSSCRRSSQQMKRGLRFQPASRNRVRIFARLVDDPRATAGRVLRGPRLQVQSSRGLLGPGRAACRTRAKTRSRAYKTLTRLLVDVAVGGGVGVHVFGCEGGVLTRVCVVWACGGLQRDDGAISVKKSGVPGAHLS